MEMEIIQDMLNTKVAATTGDVKGTGLQRMMAFQQKTRWIQDAPFDEIKLAMTLLPSAVIFLLVLIGASKTHFDAGDGEACARSHSLGPWRSDDSWATPTAARPLQESRPR